MGKLSSKTPFRMLETVCEETRRSHSAVATLVQQSCVVCGSVLYTDSKRVLQNKLYILYTVIVLHDNVPTN